MRDFVGTIECEAPSLLELAARCVKLHGIAYGPRDLPAVLIEHLASAKRCVNKRCKGERRAGQTAWSAVCYRLDRVGSVRDLPRGRSVGWM